jgi:CheY-like chemotaxis protein
MDGLEVVLYLQRQRHAVYIARNQPEALYVAARHPLHFAFVYVDPPVIDGYEVARKLRSRHGGDHLTLVAVTGRGRPSAEDRRAYHAGFDLQLERPFRREEADMVLRSPRVRSIREG